MNESSIFREIRIKVRCEERRRCLLLLLRTKPGELSAELVDRIEKEQNPDVLSRWVSQAFTAANLDEFSATAVTTVFE